MAATLLLTRIVAVPVPARADAHAADHSAAAARDAAQHDRNAEAAVLFQRAIALDPSRRLEWLRELAEQMSRLPGLHPIQPPGHLRRELPAEYAAPGWPHHDRLSLPEVRLQPAAWPG